MTDLLDDDGLLNLSRRSRTDPEAAVREITGERRETPAQNAALREWSAPQESREQDCHLCGRPPRLRCQACQRGACGADSWVMLGLCRSCATEERMKAWHKERDVSENWLG